MCILQSTLSFLIFIALSASVVSYGKLLKCLFYPLICYKISPHTINRITSTSLRANVCVFWLCTYAFFVFWFLAVHFRFWSKHIIPAIKLRNFYSSLEWMPHLAGNTTSQSRDLLFIELSSNFQCDWNWVFAITAGLEIPTVSLGKTWTSRSSIRSNINNCFSLMVRNGIGFIHNPFETNSTIMSHWTLTHHEQDYYQRATRSQMTSFAPRSISSVLTTKFWIFVTWRKVSFYKANHIDRQTD